MKNFKRTLALVLAVIMVAGMFAGVSAAKAKWYADAVRYVEGVGIATIGATAEDKITRDEFVLWIAKLESGILNDAYWGSAMETPFTDITEENNQTAIWYSARRNLIVGNGDGTFAPNKNITFAEAAAVVVRLMRYTSKVEGEAEDWQWAYMDVANEYCKAFDNTFLDNVGGSIYDYDYELTKGEAAYIIATIMNAPVIPGYQTENDYGKMTYKALTIDGMNLGERFYAREGSFGVSGNTYMVSSIEFDKEDGTVEYNSDVVLTAVSAKTEVDKLVLDADEFTSLVRVSLGLAAEAAEDEAEIRVVDTVKIGNLVDVVLDKDNEVVSLNVHSGSIVVDTHIVMDSMLSAEAPYYGNGIKNWTADSVVSGASNSNEYRDAIINSKWSSDLVYTWTVAKDGESATLTFKGEKYGFYNDTTKKNDLVVYVEEDNELDVFEGTVEELIALIPDVATGEVTLIFNDQDLDGDYDTLVVTDDYKSEFKVKFVDNQTISDKYYNEGWFIDTKTASGKLQLLVLAQGRFGHYPIEDTDKNGKVSDEDYDKNGEKETNPDVYGDNYMNPYAVIDLATISSGVIEESTLKTFNGDETYYVVTVKNAAGAREKLYIPFKMPTQAEGVPTFEYTINGVTKEFTPDNWIVSEKLAFVTVAENLTGITTVDTASDYAKKAAKLVGQYISYVVVDNEVVYCVQGAAASGEAGYLLDVEATDVDNMYNVTIATVVTGERNNGKVSDVKIYSVNATASAMMNSDYDAIASIFNKGNVHVDTDLADVVNKNSSLTITGKDVSFKGTHRIGGTSEENLYAVKVNSNGTFSYITLVDGQSISFTNYKDSTLLDGEPVRLDKVGDSNDKLVDINGNQIKDGNNFVVADDGKIYYAIQDNNDYAGSASNNINVYRTYESEFYSAPYYYFDTIDNKWYLAVTTETVAVTYTFNVDSTNVTKSNYTSISDSALKKVLSVGVGKWINVVVDEDGKTIKAYESYTVGKTPDNTYEEAKDITSGSLTVKGYKIPAEITADADGNLYATYDFRGVDRSVAIKVANKTAKITDGGVKVDNDGKGYYSFANATVTEATVVADAKKAISTVRASYTENKTDVKVTSGNAKATITWSKNIVDVDSSISNVTFTAMDKTETGYIPGSYWFSLNDANTLYFNGNKAATDVAGASKDSFAAYEAVTKADYDAIKKAGFAVSTSPVKFRTTVNTEVVLLTPTATGYVVNVMTPAEAAAKDLIISHYSFAVPAQLNEAMNITTEKGNKYNNYNNKLDAIVLVGQEALVATTPEVDDGKTVSANEYLVYVPADTETILVAPEGSKTVKVASTKSVYAIPSGTEIGSIYYEYDVYTGAEAAKIQTVIESGWYIVTENGKIVEYIDNFETAVVSKNSNGTYKNNAHVTVEGDKVVATVYVKDSNGNETSTVLATYDLSEVTFLYKDVDGTLKVVADKDAKFASDSIFTIEMKTAKAAVESAYEAAVTDADKWTPAKLAEKVAAYEAAVAAYNELLAANIDKFFNGDILDSFKATVATETSIQGDGEYTIDIYTVDEEVFVILNDWALVDLSGDKELKDDYIAVVESNLK